MAIFHACASELASLLLIIFPVVVLLQGKMSQIVYEIPNNHVACQNSIMSCPSLSLSDATSSSSGRWKPPLRATQHGSTCNKRESDFFPLACRQCCFLIVELELLCFSIFSFVFTFFACFPPSFVRRSDRERLHWFAHCLRYAWGETSLTSKAFYVLSKHFIPGDGKSH